MPAFLIRNVGATRRILYKREAAAVLEQQPSVTRKQSLQNNESLSQLSHFVDPGRGVSGKSSSDIDQSHVVAAHRSSESDQSVASCDSSAVSFRFSTRAAHVEAEPVQRQAEILRQPYQSDSFLVRVAAELHSQGHWRVVPVASDPDHYPDGEERRRNYIGVP